MNERIASGASLVTEIYLDHMFVPELVFDTWSYKRHFTFNLDLTFQLTFVDISHFADMLTRALNIHIKLVKSFTRARCQNKRTSSRAIVGV